MERGFAKLKVTPKAERTLRQGHPWVYGEEITGAEGSWENGEIVDVFSAKGRWLGSGFINEHSKIRVRIISRNTNDRFDEAFFRRRMAYAIRYRKDVMGEDFAACRLIFGEADQFPGLTVDRFGDVLVTEVLSLGIDRRKELIYRLLVEELNALGAEVRAIYERSDSSLRAKEGLEPFSGFAELPGLETDLDGHTRIRENGLLFDVDYIRGQKTGFFLDQKYNRAAAARLAAGRRVLDCFTHTGAFALNAAKAGAEKVTAVDVSAEALKQANENARLNGLEEKLEFRQADVFELLTEAAKGPKLWDYIILDPPAFTKSSRTVDSAYRGYRELNRRAMQLLPRGGYLATCSCSHFMTAALFREMLREAALDAGVSLRQIEERQQAPDHPILWGVPETDYLKFFLFQVV
ncbi:MAG: class I SAM-dependent rRNA methyltransferase [Oscillospiraceae bacterium]|nr:class I SAM-dependent rRNA methyltransferase [Oscillospiraceae bacterium]